jgi:signal transduction histidine kinase
LLGYTTLLLDGVYGPLNAEQAKGVERTQRAATHLLELVNDALDLSKIEAGKIDLRVEPVLFPSVVEDLFATVKPLADNEGSALDLVNADCHLTIVTDPRRVRQILLNLLSNAIKFGAGKPVEVTCNDHVEGGITIEVTDHGPGIPAEDQERIFHEFVQLEKPAAPGSASGTGLGLPISRRLAELLRGTLTVRSTIGGGSTFRLSLPADIETRPAPFVREVTIGPVDESGATKAALAKHVAVEVAAL